MSENRSNPISDPERSSYRASSGSQTSPEQAATASSADAALLRRVEAGEHNAMTELFDRYSSPVYSVALSVLRDPGHAEDVVQEVFLQVWKSPSAFVQGRGSLGGWLIVVARNRAIDFLRRRKPTDSVEDVVLASSVDVASEAERNNVMERVGKILKDLPQEQQEPMQLAFFEGLSHSEIAERTGHPLGTVKTRIRLALASIRKALAV